jgi:hypothetical protein
MLPSIRFGADWRTLARLRNAAQYCLRHIVQCQLLASLASRATSWRSTAISAEVNRSGKIKKLSRSYCANCAGVNCIACSANRMLLLSV